MAKKIVKGVFYALCVAFLAWFVLSWADVVADNCEPNPHHSKYNIFVLLTEYKQEQEDNKVDKNDLVDIEHIDEGACGDPLTYIDNVRFSEVYEITDTSVVFRTTDTGDLYETYVGNPSEFEENGFYCLFFEGEEIVKAFVERW